MACRILKSLRPGHRSRVYRTAMNFDKHALPASSRLFAVRHRLCPNARLGIIVTPAALPTGIKIQRLTFQADPVRSVPPRSETVGRHRNGITNEVRRRKVGCRSDQLHFSQGRARLLRRHACRRGRQHLEQRCRRCPLPQPRGELLGKILVPYRVSNLTFGGLAKNRLFIGASNTLYSIFLNCRGVQAP